MKNEPPLTSIEQLTIQFYEWEKRGRGWYVFDNPVDLEPPFAPFFYHYKPTQVIDDGAVPGIFDGLSKLFSPKQPVQKEPEPENDFIPFEYVPEGPLCIISVTLPKGHVVDTEEAEQLLLMLSVCQNPVSFEIIADSASIAIQFVCREPDDMHVKSQLKAYFPQGIIQEKDGSIRDIISKDKEIAVIDLGLRDEFMRPLATAKNFNIDPLVGLFGMLENLEGTDRVVLQILFKGAVDPWAKSIITSVTDSQGDSFFLDAPEMPKLAEEKISHPLYGVVIRAIGQSDVGNRAYAIAKNLGRILCQVSQSECNSLITLSNEEYPIEEHIEDVILRQSHRLGMILNSSELVNFVHLPSSSVVSSKLVGDTRKTKAVPAIAQGHDLILGMNIHQGQNRVVSVSSGQRLRHTHLIGATGTGKTTLLESCIVQDIRQGRGIAVLDPHGDLIESILSHIPNNRISDVVLVDPSDALFPIGFNILSANSDIEKDVLSSDLVAVFRRLSTSWGDQMNSVFANAILAFLENSKGGTLMDLRRFLVEKDFRATYLRTVTDPNIVYYWQKEYPLLKSASIGPILTRLDTFLRPKLVRNMVAQKKSLDFENILNTGKILLVKLSQGLIGDENSYLLGTVFVSKIYQAAMARQAKGKAERNDFFLYVDEFQNFITPSMSLILAGARKYHLGLILAHQDMQQLVKEDSTLAGSIIANAGTRICFRLGDTDAKRFEDGFSSFDANDLQNLGIGEAIVRIERPENDFTLTTIELDKPEQEQGEAVRNAVISLSREKYSALREEVERFMDYLKDDEKITEQPQELIKKEPIPKIEEPKVEIQYPVIEKVEPVEIQDSKTKDALVKQKELSQHRYLQMHIKRMAEMRGYKASIEELTPDGQGRVDVLLTRGEKRIACEIGITTTKEWETHNVVKCLNAGYEVVIAVPVDKKAAEMMQMQVSEKISANLQPRVFVMEAHELFEYLDKEIAKEASTEERIKGYRVIVKYDALSDEAMKRKKDSISKMIIDTIKDKNGKKK